jgi:hypothetical protein
MKGIKYLLGIPILIRLDSDPCFGNSRPDLAASQSNWNPSYSKSAKSENNDFKSANALLNRP